MLEIDKIWFPVQVINFLLLIWILNILLFRPLLRLFKEREARTKGFLDNAKDMDKEKDALLHQIETKLSEARSRSKTVFEDLRQQGLALQKESVESAKKGAIVMSRKAKEDLESETEKTKTTLRKDIEAFSKKIVEKMVGV